MPSKLRKAIGAVKDQTSISLAKVSNTSSSALDVAVLKATTHDELPIDDRYVTEILLLTSCNNPQSSACAQAISKRIARTRNWVVAIKSLLLILRLFQHGDSQFPHHLNAAKRRGGTKTLNFSNSSPWDHAYFVRTFALYLDEHLQSLLKGKLSKDRRPVREMTLETLLDRISCWQRLLDRVVATEPTGAAKGNKLVQTCLYAVVKESFHLYNDVSDGLSFLLDSFYQLEYQHCVDAYQICVKAAKQFEELSSFYNLCKSIEVGRGSEYPSVQTVSEELIESLQEFLRDHSSLQSGNGGRLAQAADPSEPSSPFNPREMSETDEQSERTSESNACEVSEGSEQAEKTSQSTSVDQERCSERSQMDDEDQQWELQLAKMACDVSITDLNKNFESTVEPGLVHEDHHQHHNYVNPFLQLGASDDVPEFGNGEDSLSLFPTFQPTTPTFSVKNPDESTVSSRIENDPFAPLDSIDANVAVLDGSASEQQLLEEQQLWLEQQNKIIARRIT